MGNGVIPGDAGPAGSGSDAPQAVRKSPVTSMQMPKMRRFTGPLLLFTAAAYWA